MSPALPRITPIRWWELPAIARMTRYNLGEVDQQLRHLLQHPVWHWWVRLIGPFYLGAGGTGYKALLGRQIAGCAFISFRRQSGYIYNVQVNEAWRRQRIGWQLMAHLEEQALSKGYGWTALYVDRGNEAGRSLYQHMGYRPYFSHYWRRRQADGWPLPPSRDVQVKALRRPEAVELHQYFSQHELFHGDAWAARLVADDYPISLPAGGLSWRCLHEGTEIGFAWGDYLRDRPVLNLYLHHHWWGNGPILAATLAAVREAAGWQSSYMDLLLGSSGHGNASQTALLELGFQQRTQARLLLLKSLLSSVDGDS